MDFKVVLLLDQMVSFPGGALRSQYPKVSQLMLSKPTDSSSNLRSRLKREGYLFFRNFIRLDLISEAREVAIRLCREAGFAVKSDKKLGDRFIGTYDHKEFDILRERCVRTWVHSPSYKKIILDTKVIDLLALILEDRPFPHPNPLSKLGRIVPPGRYFGEMKAHQDLHYLEGPNEFYSMWVPCGDCPVELGALAILSGSHVHGFLEHSELGVEIPGASQLWLTSDYSAGDMLLFHSCTIHKPLPNLTEDTIRLALDFRYCGASQLLKTVSDNLGK